MKILFMNCDKDLRIKSLEERLSYFRRNDHWARLIARLVAERVKQHMNTKQSFTTEQDAQQLVGRNIANEILYKQQTMLRKLKQKN